MSPGVGRADVIVIGAGMAGLSAGAEIARDREVVVLEAEPGPSQHTTGRSAAVSILRYGGPGIEPYNRLSRAWFEAAGHGLADRPLCTPRGLLVVAAPGDQTDLGEHHDEDSRDVSAREAVELFGVLRPEMIARAHLVPGVVDIDVAGVVAAFRRALRELGGRLVTSARVTGLRRAAGSWSVSTGAGEWQAGMVVNAAGAWADEVAQLAGLPPLGLVSLRRTMCAVPAPDGLGQERWPMLLDASERFYMKPEPGHFLASPVDETPSPPGDPRPDMIDVATALERVADATTLDVSRISTAWAGLRTFAPDRCLVLGPDPLEPSFAWCAGQGGFGIQSGPAAAMALASLVAGRGLPDALLEAGPDAAHVLPDRLR